MKLNVLDAPSFCQYEAGACTKIKAKLELQDAFFGYASKPETISSQIAEAVLQIRDQNVCSVQDWRELSIGGRIIFCEICKSIRRSGVFVADLTTLNDNVIFEIGFSIGLGKRIWLIRDTSYEKDQRLLKGIGLLDYTGYTDFRSSGAIVSKFLLHKPWDEQDPNAASNPFFSPPHLAPTSRLVYLKSNHASDGSIELTSLVKKSRLPITTIDPGENIQLSLREYARSITSSIGVLVHMVDVHRQDSTVHNARCALMAGLALAMEKPVLILQEGERERPIDFGEIVRSYTNAKNISLLFDYWIDTPTKLYKQAQQQAPVKHDGRKLARLNLGELAAENEIEELDHYFVKTSTYTTLLNQHDAIVAGRKGTGKTALFYGIRANYWKRNHFVVLDLKPEGHQLKLFGSVILNGFPGATRQYLIKSFWEYVILSELGRKILKDQTFAFQEPDTVTIYNEIERTLNPLDLNWEGDFAQRLLELVNSLKSKLENTARTESPAQITEYLYKNDLPRLRDAIERYLVLKKGTVILIDNLDKDWKPFEDISVEIDILRSLLDSMKGLSNTFSKSGVHLWSYVFIRNDILRLLHQKTPDKGKTNIVQLQWSDKETLRQVIRERLQVSSGDGSAEWAHYFSPDCKGVDSFSYMLDRTLMRPRDILSFCKASIETALGRGHDTVDTDDILHAEKTYSTRMLGGLVDEIKDVYGDIESCFLEFLDEQLPITEARVRELLESGLGPTHKDDVGAVLELLLEYGFLGVETAENEFSYSVDSPDNLVKMKKRAEKLAKREGGQRSFVVHPTFRAGLGIAD